jgi:hypothetical protein
MKEEKKSIKIDPTLFTFSDPKTNKTRKKDKPKGGRIPKIRTTEDKKRNTLKKQTLLRMIRQHQDDNYKKLFEKKINENKQQEYKEQKELYDSFDSSRDYLENLLDSKKKNEIVKPKNTTIKDRTNLLNTNNTNNSSSGITLDLSHIMNNNAISFDNIETHSTQNSNILNEPVKINEAPKYGVLKGGKLPTYRSYFNKTQKNLESTGSIYEKMSFPESNTRNREIKEKINKKTNYGPIYKHNKQKKIKRRTFKAGKSQQKPKIGVLISNKTIRNNTNLKIMKIKEEPISKIKKELVRRGLIKIGTITPNDVLRKMHETVELLCGDVQNHNKDNLLYNFINEK